MVVVSDVQWWEAIQAETIRPDLETNIKIWLNANDYIKFTPDKTTIHEGNTNTNYEGGIISYQQNNESDLLALSLPSSSLKFSVANFNALFNPLNPAGLAGKIKKKSRVTVSYGYSVGGTNVSIDPAGEYYLTDWNAGSNSLNADFQAGDIFSLMTGNFDISAYRAYANGDCYKGTYRITAKMLVDDALTQCGIDTSLSTITSTRQVNFPVTPNDDGTGTINFDGTCAELVQYVANLLGGMLCTNIASDDGERSGKIYLKQFPSVAEDYRIDKSNSYKTGEAQIEDAVDAVVVENTGAAFPSVVQGVVQTISNPLYAKITDGENIAHNTYSIMSQRVSIKGEYRVDPRIDLFDIVTVETKFGTYDCIITSIDFNYNGALRGNYYGVQLIPLKLLQFDVDVSTGMLYYTKPLSFGATADLVPKTVNGNSEMCLNISSDYDTEEELLSKLSIVDGAIILQE